MFSDGLVKRFIAYGGVVPPPSAFVGTQSYGSLSVLADGHTHAFRDDIESMVRGL